MADKDRPEDLRPATEFGEVKVIKNDLHHPPGVTPGSAEPGAAEEPAPPRAQRTIDKAQRSAPGKTPGRAGG
jgi:hypothetical protein